MTIFAISAKTGGALLLAAALVFPARAARDAEAEHLIDDVLSRAILVIEDDALPPLAKEERLRVLMKDSIAVNRIAFFLLGRYARVIDKALRREYLDLLEDYTVTLYARRALAFNPRGITMEVKSSRKKGKKDREAIVATALNAENFERPVEIEWWLVRDKAGDYKIFNLGFEGLWIAQEQRASFGAIIERAGGDPSALNRWLREKLADNEIEEQ